MKRDRGDAPLRAEQLEVEARELRQKHGGGSGMAAS